MGSAVQPPTWVLNFFNTYAFLLSQEHLPELWQHFQEQGVEVHMFASQWFLTLYTAKFPLFMVFHYLDLFLLIGLDSVFQVALALLQVSG